MIRTFLSGGSFSQRAQSIQGTGPSESTTQCNCQATEPCDSVSKPEPSEPEPCPSSIPNESRPDTSNIPFIHNTMQGALVGTLFGVLSTVLVVCIRDRRRPVDIVHSDELDSLHLEESTDKQIV